MSAVRIPCSDANYGGQRQEVEYIVLHYTAGDGDTARSNGAYFANNAVSASAHFFVDEQEVVCSVPLTEVAWHCGAERYRHNRCRNANSIGVELCSKKENGVYCFPEATLAKAAALVRQLMEVFAVPVERVLRHYDVTGKTCPEPFVRREADWQAFLSRLQEDGFEERLQQYLQKLSACAPGSWSEQARQWAEGLGLVRGDGQGLAYRRPVTREELVEILYRWKGETT